MPLEGAWSSVRLATLFVPAGVACIVLALCVARFVADVLLGRRNERHMVVLVLGDVGRSPRMQYHCLSLAALPACVSLVGYKGEECVPELRADARISEHLISPPEFTRRFPRILGMVTKVLLQTAQLFWMLFVELPAIDVLLVQNPPCIPTLLVALLVSCVRRCRVVVDWHNFGYTLLALRFASGRRHPLVRFAKLYERVCGRLCHGGLCVTKAMQGWLLEHWGVQAHVLYDRAPTAFRCQQPEERRALFLRLGEEYPVFRRMLDPKQAPALVVSSTSWTADEDFGMLLAAIERLDKLPGPPLLFVITGKGPQKEYYERKIASMTMQRCEITTAWLAAADYPRLLGSATLGVSLHTSSSGYDLPMKVVDMFGAGLPVCALGFPCLSELVDHGHNGMVFESAETLAEQMQDLLGHYPEDSTKLDALQKGVLEFQKIRWQDNWQTNAAPLFAVKRP
eukprot:CAMPEP_0117512852 /NCGR_PEP_ID=MMETSP0784-20121206/29247_1 /TAXON_ID=39447 /ORGANISM="" /LENGTH=453 /DNA_ID=CAMNT_0005308589 /DNA_START=101 /DNA_END=1459 /DNA_ORIENTATION=+